MTNNLIEDIKILYEDEGYVGIDKPSGLQVHPDGRNKGPFLTDWFVDKYPESSDVGEPMRSTDGGKIHKPGVVHRLDTETSGVIVMAKTQPAFLGLKKQFKKREVKKTYKALAYGDFKEKQGIIDREIGKSKKDFRMWSAQRGSKGKRREATTYYRVLREGLLDEEKVSLLEIRPKTGRTHQIRVHMKAIHHPIVCDSLYAPNHNCLGLSRLALHAQSIEFNNLEETKTQITSQIPKELEDYINKL